MEATLTTISDYVWGPVMLTLILGTGIYLMVRLRFMPIRRLGYGFKQLFQGRKGQGNGEISPFNALMTSLSATIGTGNITGVATAIGVGGPGALFWMWCTALVGMATKYAEAVCAIEYREVDEKGKYVGGPMYYIKNGMGKNWAWLAAAFAVFGMLAGFGIGNMVQANAVANVLNSTLGFSQVWVAVVLMILVGLVLIGGIKWIGKVAGKLVPIMAITYIGLGLLVLAWHITDIPGAFMLIIKSAFAPQAIVGATIGEVIRQGVSRGVFSNEAGLGSAPIAHAAAQTDDPVRQGTIAMLGTFIDTIIICTITGLVIIVTGVWQGDLSGAAMSASAFDVGMPFGGGNIAVAIAQALFAFTTILGWSYYGERCTEYLFGCKMIIPFRVLWVAAIPIGALATLSMVWSVADILNGLMIVPNVIGLLALAGVVTTLTRKYQFKQDKG